VRPPAAFTKSSAPSKSWRAPAAERPPAVVHNRLAGTTGERARAMLRPHVALLCARALSGPFPKKAASHKKPIPLMHWEKRV
jgi:hypothetical protein